MSAVRVATHLARRASVPALLAGSVVVAALLWFLVFGPPPPPGWIRGEASISYNAYTISQNLHDQNGGLPGVGASKTPRVLRSDVEDQPRLDIGATLAEADAVVLVASADLIAAAIRSSRRSPLHARRSSRGDAGAGDDLAGSCGDAALVSERAAASACASALPASWA